MFKIGDKVKSEMAEFLILNPEGVGYISYVCHKNPWFPYYVTKSNEVYDNPNDAFYLGRAFPMSEDELYLL